MKPIAPVVAIFSAIAIGIVIIMETKSINETYDLQPTAGGAFNNPLNIRKTSILWKGEILPVNNSSAFESFASMAYGFRAALVNMRTHYSRDGADTIRKQITIWAPLGDGKNDPTQYTQTVTNYLRAIYPDFNPDANAQEYLYTDRASDLLLAMTYVEQGSQFAVNEDDLREGIKLA